MYQETITSLRTFWKGFVTIQEASKNAVLWAKNCLEIIIENDLPEETRRKVMKMFDYEARQPILDQSIHLNMKFTT